MDHKNEFENQWRSNRLANVLGSSKFGISGLFFKYQARQLHPPTQHTYFHHVCPETSDNLVQERIFSVQEILLRRIKTEWISGLLQKMLFEKILRIFSHESNSIIAKVHLNVCQFKIKTPQESCIYAISLASYLISIC